MPKESIFSDHELEIALAQVKFEPYADKPNTKHVKIAELPLLLQIIINTAQKFRIGKFLYAKNYGILLQINLEAPEHKDILDEISYFVDGIPVKLRDIKAKMEKLKCL